MIFITGSKGQLGRAVVEEATKRDISYTELSRSTLDISNKEAVDEYFNDRGGRSDCIVNCSAYTLVDTAEDHPSEAYVVNAYAPWVLAQTRLPVLHVSTDYVFDGTATSPYHIDAHCAPISVYGLSKRAGEMALLAARTKGAIVRTSWLYSARPDTKNFFHTIRRLAKTANKLTVVNDQIGAPTLAEDLAAALLDLYERGAHTHQMHILHFSNAGRSTWYDFATAIMKETASTVKVEPISSSLYPTKAKRPAYSLLDLTTIYMTYGIKPRHWLDALSDAVSCICQNNTNKEKVR